MVPLIDPTGQVERHIRNGVEHYRDPRGTWVIWFPRLDVVATQFEQHMTREMALVVLAWLDQRVQARGALHAFHDWSRMSSYDSGARNALMGWVMRNPGALASLTILTRSTLVSMGVAAANAVLGGNLFATRDPAEYERLLNARSSEPSGIPRPK